MTEDQMKSLGYQIIDYIVAHRKNLPHKRVHNYSNFQALSQLIPQDIPYEGEDPVEVFQELNALLDNHIFHTDHPRFFSFIPGPSNYISILAETLATGYNVFAGHWMAGSAAAMIEKTTLAWLTQLFDYPAESGGIFLSGGSMANLSAIATARHMILGEDFSQGTIYYSHQTHSSMQKGLRILGISAHQWRPIPTTKDFRIDLHLLQQTINQDIKDGHVPFCMVGNAGTTNTGTVDDLHALADIAQQFQAWFHIDGAYGAAAILSQPYRQEISGIERADSITLDPHKWWFQPFETGCLIVKNKEHLAQTFSVNAGYLDDTISQQQEINYYNYGPQLTRSFRAIKLYTYLRCIGVHQLGEYITQGIKLAEYIEELLAQRDHWEMMAKPSLGIIAFRVKIGTDDTTNDRINQTLSEFMLEDGFALITTTKLHQKVVLRMCPIHPDTTQEDIELTIARMNRFVDQQRENFLNNRFPMIP